MKVLYLPLMGVLLLAAISQCTPNTRIVGGENTVIERYPSLVQVEHFIPFYGAWNQNCAGNILSSRWILSAAHCFPIQNSTDYARIRAGSSFREFGGSVHYIDIIRIHPNYTKPAPHDADISVIRVRTPFVYSPSIRPGVIARQGYFLPDNSPATIAGWGALYFGVPSSFMLQNVILQSIPREVCANLYQANNMTITENMFCVNDWNWGWRNACHGDAGGAFYNRNIIVGVASYTQGCGNPMFPTISTSVGAFSDWIITNAR
ncbi:trypsin, alkaline C-like [Colias croceus]|uniref:trypsin, alkaline C-like n=1 Tax=Colias crocea TaxID=72248 RepID=UPI001E27C593|nr:trypsin, alkaline C-like [Colias croceus]